MLSSHDTLILLQSSKQLQLIVCTKMHENIHVKLSHTFYGAFQNLENINQLAHDIKQLLITKNIEIPKKIHLYLNIENVIIKKWSLPFASRSNANKALQHLLKREIPTDISKLTHIFLFQRKRFKENRTIFSFTVLKEAIHIWTEAFNSTEYFIDTISFVPFVLLKQVQKTQSIFLYQEGNTSLIAYKNTHEIQEIRIIQHNNLHSQNMIKEFINLIDINAADIFAQAQEINISCDMDLQNEIRISLTEKYNLPLSFITKNSLYTNKEIFNKSLNSSLNILKKYTKKLINIPYLANKGNRINNAYTFQPLSRSENNLMERELLLINILLKAHFPFSSIFPNFAKKHTNKTQYSFKHLNTLRVASIALILTFCLFLLSINNETKKITQQASVYKNLTSEIFHKAVPNISQNLTMRQIKSILKSKITQSPKSQENQFEALQILDAIHLASQPDMSIQLTQYSYTDKTSRVSGTIKSYEHLNLFIKNLKNITSIPNIEIAQANTNKQNTVIFELRISNIYR